MINKSNHLGVSLIEVLITLVVVGVGLLGFTKLQLGSIDLSVYAHQRSMATAIAHDYIERIRANPDQLEFYVHSVSGTQDADESDTAPENQCVTGVCNPSALAVNDKFWWQEHINSQQYSNLISPRSSLSCDGEGREALCELAIFWQKKVSIFNSTGSFSQPACNPDQSSESRSTADVTTEYHCVKIQFKPEQRKYVSAS